MCTATLKQELNWQIDSLPDENVRLLIEVAKSMNPGEAKESAALNSHKRKAGVLKGGLIYMADDFDETPECFKEWR